MPFDATPTETKPIDRLIERLRTQARVDWDFTNSDLCAFCDMQAIRREMGMPTRRNYDDFVSDDAARHVLFGFDFNLRYGEGELVRPRHVASALEHYRDTGEALSPFEFVKREWR